jgi:hypothetical protein
MQTDRADLKIEVAFGEQDQWPVAIKRARIPLGTGDDSALGRTSRTRIIRLTSSTAETIIVCQVRILQRRSTPQTSRPQVALIL